MRKALRTLGGVRRAQALPAAWGQLHPPATRAAVKQGRCFRRARASQGQLQGIHRATPSEQGEMRVCGLRARARPGLQRCCVHRPRRPDFHADRRDVQGHGLHTSARPPPVAEPPPTMQRDDANRCSPGARNVCIAFYRGMFTSQGKSKEAFLEHPGSHSTHGPTDPESHSESAELGRGGHLLLQHIGFVTRGSFFHWGLFSCLFSGMEK